MQKPTARIDAVGKVLGQHVQYLINQTSCGLQCRFVYHLDLNIRGASFRGRQYLVRRDAEFLRDRRIDQVFPAHRLAIIRVVDTIFRGFHHAYTRFGRTVSRTHQHVATVTQASDTAIQKFYGLFVANEKSNDQIVDDGLMALEERRSPILLTERKEHLEQLHDRLKDFVRHIVILRGGRSAKERRKIEAQLASIPVDEERLILATGRYIGEGFDDARLDTLFLALPVSWKGTLVQYAGRLHRLHPGKHEVRIVDYVDSKVPMLARMFERRRVGYRAMGYREDDHGTLLE